MSSFEDVFLLPEPQLHDILRKTGYQSQGFLIDRYIATVVFANSMLLKPEDYKCATNPKFQQLYLNDDALMQLNLPGYVSRFTRLRMLLGCVKFCNEEAIKRAIDKYPGKNRFGEPEIMRIPLKQLAQEFGKDAFNTEYLNQLWDNFALARDPLTEEHLSLDPIIFNALQSYHRWEKEANMSPEEYGTSHWKPTWGLNWLYLKCLLRIFQGDPRTRQEIDGMPTNAELGI
jgi:hypothetical protein